MSHADLFAVRFDWGGGGKIALTRPQNNRISLGLLDRAVDVEEDKIGQKYK